MHSQDDVKDLAAMKIREWPQTPGFDAALRAVTEAVLNCYTREGGEWRPLPAATLTDLADKDGQFVAVAHSRQDVQERWVEQRVDSLEHATPK